MAAAGDDRGGEGNSLDFRRNFNVQHQQDRPFADRDGAQFNFSSEELRALKDCNKESFYQRSLPFSAVAAFSTHFAVKAGYLKANPKYGSLWKVIFASSVAYFVGKFSYRQKCAEKLMRLPNSKIGEALRRRQQGLPTDANSQAFDQSYFAGIPDLTPPSAGPADRMHETDIGSGLWDIDDDKNVKFQGLDESQRPSLDTESTSPAQQDAKPPVYSTYENLRQQNRDEYEMRRLNAFSRKDVPGGRRPPMAPNPNTGTSTNEYGDRLE